MYQPIVETKEAFYVEERYVSANSRGQRSLLCRRKKKDMYQPIVEAKEAFYVEERYVSANSRGQRSLLCRRKICISQQSRPKKPSMQKKDMYQPIVEAKEAFYVEERYVSANSRGQRSLLCRRKICISQQSRPKKPSMQKKDMYQPIVEAKEAFYVEERYVSANSRDQRSLLCRRKICISQYQPKSRAERYVSKEAFYVEDRYVSANSRGQRSLLCRRKICISQQSRPKKPSMQKKDMYQPIVEAKEAFYVEERYVSANSRGQRSLLCRRKICISQQSRPKKPSMQKKDMYQPIVEAKEAFYVEERYVSANSRGQRSLLCKRKICISQQSRPKKPSMQKKDTYQPIVEAKEAFYVEERYVSANSRGQRSLLCRRKICISQQSRPKKPSMQKKDMYQPIVEAKEAFYVEERYVSANSRGQRSLLCRRKICISQQSRPKKPKKPSMQKKDMYQPIVEAKEAFYVEERYVSANSRGQRSLLCRRKIYISQQSRPKKPSMQKKDMYQPIVEAKEAFYVEERYVSANSRDQRSLLCRRKIANSISQQSRPKKPSMQKKDMYQPIVEAKEAFYVEERYVSANSRGLRSLLCRRKICISQQSRPKKPSMQKKDMYLCRRKICISQQSRPKKPSMQKKDMYQPIVEAKEAFYVEERYVSANSRGQRSLLCRRKICISQQSRPKKPSMQKKDTRPKEPSMQKKDMCQPIVEAKEAFYVEERYVSANSRGQRSLLCRRKICISQQSRPKKPSMQKKDMYQPIVETKEAFYVEERYVSANSRGQRSLLCRRKICISQQSRPKKPSMQKKDMYQPIVETKEAFYVEEIYVSANSRGQRSLLCRRKIRISQQSRPKKPSMQKKDTYQPIVEAKEAFYVEERYVSANNRGQRSLLCRRKICISQQSRPKKPSMQQKDRYQPIVEAK